jgi:cysteinyl-tRNA synthetase
MIDFISKLINSNNAYEKNGTVYFDIKSISGYGKLSNQKLDMMHSEEKSVDKKNQQDFAL